MIFSRITAAVSACLVLAAAAAVAAGDVPDDRASAIRNSQRDSHSSNDNAHRELSFAAFRGCVEDEAYTIPEGNECYAVDSSICSFLYNRDCREVTARYNYYNGGRTRTGAEPFEEEFYNKIAISATRGCNRGNRCTIAVDGVACNSCTNSGPQYRLITMADCSNLENDPFATMDEPQTIVLGSGGGHFELAVVEERCEHPALLDAPEGATILSIAPHQFQYSLSSELDDLTVPETPQISVLVSDTNEYFTGRLPGIFSDVTGFQILPGWQSRYTGGGSVANGVTGNLFLDCTLRVTLQAPMIGETATTEQNVIDYLAIPSVMNAYLTSTVRTSNPVFVPTDSVVSRVVEE